MDPKDLIGKPGEKGMRVTAGGADDHVQKSTTGEKGVPADKKHISPLAAAAIAVALKIYFSAASSICSAGVLSR